MNQINWMAISTNKVTVDFSIDETNNSSLDDAKILTFFGISSDIIKYNNINMTFTVPSQLTKENIHRPYPTEHCVKLSW
jgi:hypothetical protein